MLVIEHESSLCPAVQFGVSMGRSCRPKLSHASTENYTPYVEEWKLEAAA